jgi:Domain of unknown function (DUF222)/HNH endonuclease
MEDVALCSLSHEHRQRLADEISRLSSYLYAAEHRLLTLLREFDAGRGWEGLGFPSCACWLNFKCGMDGVTARERMRVAHALGRLPKVDARFASGALSYSKVRAITRIATEENEDYLLQIAKHGTAHHVEQLVRKYRHAKRLQDTDRARARHDGRQLSWFFDEDDCLVIKGRLPPEQGALIVKALEMAMDRDFAEQNDAKDDSAESSSDVIASSSDVIASEAKQSMEPIGARRADALAAVAETYMNSDPVPNATADRYQVVVHVSAESSAAHIHDGPGVSAETARRIACDSSLIAVKEDQDGEPLSVGRKTRSIPPAIRRALIARDGGCRFPGCTHNRFVDGHHIEHWADGGETSLDNLILLCRHHHRLVHEGDFACEKTESGEVVFKDQRNMPLPTYGLLPTVDPDVLDAWLDRQLFEPGVDPESCGAVWYAGDRMNWDLAVGNLFQ